MLHFLCPLCDQPLQCEENYSGMLLRCPGCNKKIKVPEPEGEEPAPQETSAGGKRNLVVVRGTTGSAPPAAAPRTYHAHGDAARRADATNVSVWLSLTIGLGFALVLYGILFPFRETYLAQLFNKRGWVPYVLALFTGWSVGFLLLKFAKLRRQRQAMLLNVLPTEIAEDITPDNVHRFIEHVDGLPAHLHRSFLVQRMRHGLAHFSVRHSNPEVASMMMVQSEIDAGAIRSSYSMLKVLIWAIPILGFIGTVIGISNAIGGFSGSLDAVKDIEVLKQSLNQVTAGLAIAFDTTLLALVLSLLISFPTSAMQAAEEALLAWVDETCNENLLRRLNDAGGLADVAKHTSAIMQSVGEAVSGNQQQILAEFRDVQEAQVAAVGRLGEVLDGQIQDMEARSEDYQEALKQNLRALTESLCEAVEGIVRQGRVAQQEAEVSVKQTADQLQSSFAQLGQGLDSLNRVLGELDGKQVVIEKPRRSWFGGKSKRET